MTDLQLPPGDTDAVTTAVLQMSLVRDQRAIDRLLDLLASPPERQSDLFGHLLHTAPWPEGFPGPKTLVDSSPGVERLVGLKDSGKRLAASATGELDRLRGTAIYALAVAAALAHHQQMISSAASREMSALLMDFAELTPEPWRRLFEAAAKQGNFGHRSANGAS